MGYFNNIKEAVVSIAKGMGVTIRQFFTHPETIQFPEDNVLDSPMEGYKGHLKPVADRFRGFLTVEPESCIVDMICARACPVDCIQIEGAKGPKTRAPQALPEKKEMPKSRYPTRFDIHLGRCMYCGLCVDVCPTGAIHFTREFRGATGEYDELIRRCIPEEEREKVNKMAEEHAAGEAEEKAKKEAEEKEKKSESDEGGEDKKRNAGKTEGENE